MITEVKAGRAISAKNMDLIRRAYEALGELLDAYGDEDPGNEEKSAGIPVDEVLALLGIKENQ